jgi:hypothetical protein
MLVTVCWQHFDHLAGISCDPGFIVMYVRHQFISARLFVVFAARHSLSLSAHPEADVLLARNAASAGRLDVSWQHQLRDMPNAVRRNKISCH